MPRFNSTELAENAVVLGDFSTGNTVTITLYNAFSGALIPVDSNTCAEIGTTGSFVFSLSQITTALSVFTQVYWEMDNSSIIRSGNFEALGWAEGVSTIIPANMCKVNTLIYTPDDQSGVLTNRLQSDLEKAYAQIQGTFFQSVAGKHFDTNQQKPYYADTGEAFWLLPQGSTVKFFIKQLGINQEALIPALSTIDLDTILNT